MNTDKIIEMIEQSELWNRLNETCKKMYEAEGRTPNEEEYQALRNILIFKVMQADKSISEEMSKQVWESLQ